MNSQVTEHLDILHHPHLLSRDNNAGLLCALEMTYVEFVKISLAHTRLLLMIRSPPYICIHTYTHTQTYNQHSRLGRGE